MRIYTSECVDTKIGSLGVDLHLCLRSNEHIKMGLPEELDGVCLCCGLENRDKRKVGVRENEKQVEGHLALGLRCYV
ncbi:hypothetical protein C1H46_024747 [Malus baccata]|uniref:Uncharacterized protein n=1 Tax=Malus baccata TaxID=106549 RepID=A0A540LTA5_MALBA|nr:hypothetical protein C1H46_024747 [Malus baccata]